jgi:hypothetical protein
MGSRNRHFLIPAKSNTCWEVIACDGRFASWHRFMQLAHDPSPAS